MPDPVRAPRLYGQPIIGVALQMRNDPLGTMTRGMQKLGDTIYLQLGLIRATLFRNPEHIKHIFIDNAANYTKNTRGYRKSQIVLGQGLVTSEGALWQRQRRIANPAFSRSRVTSFAGTMVEHTKLMLDAWDGEKRGEVDIFAEMMRVTLHIAVVTLMGIGPSDELNRVSAATTEVLERTNDIITNPLHLPLWLPTQKNRNFKNAIATLNRFVYDTITRKRSEQQQGTDLLSMLLAARDEETGEGMSDVQLRDEAVTILIAGHETTANVLTWSLWLLAKHPEIQQRVFDEVQSVLNGRLPDVNDVPNLKLVRAVLDEGMRLYPPAWMIGRHAVNDDNIGGFKVVGGKEFVLVSPYMTHRNPNLWDKPNEFDPDRFLDGRADRLPKFSFLPFGGGQRFCIGANFANLQSSLMLATILQRYSFEVVPEHPVVPYAMITLRPKHGIRLKVNAKR